MERSIISRLTDPENQQLYDSSKWTPQEPFISISERQIPRLGGAEGFWANRTLKLRSFTSSLKFPFKMKIKVKTTMPARIQI